jgi:hypothetical protein
MSSAAVATIARHIFKCPCKNVWTVESNPQTVSAKLWYELNNNRQVCPACSRYMVRGTLVRGTFNAEKVCNAKCMGATSGVCECNCAGSNHGAGH